MSDALLEKKRHAIDTIDSEIVKLLAKRMELAMEIGAYKKEHNMQVQNLEREKALLANLREIANEHRIDPQLIETLYQQIMEHSRTLQGQ